MTRAEFWALISLLAWDRLEDDADFAVSEPLIDALTQLEPSEIEAFDDLLAEMVWNLDGRAWALAAGVSGELEDLFLYARLCVIANGEEAYEAIRDDPSMMPTGLQFDELLFVAERAYQRRTGRDYTHEPPFSMEKGSNEANW